MNTTGILAIEEWRPDHEHAATFDPDVEARQLHRAVFKWTTRVPSG